MAEEVREEPYVAYLEKFKDDRAVLAALRRGLGQSPGGEPAMFPYIVPFIHESTSPWAETVHYMIASLYGFHSQSGGRGNMGNHFAALKRDNADSPAVERRFVTLMAAHPEDLAFVLRQGISLLKSKDVPVNWHQLMRDALRWYWPESRAIVCKQWASEFWK